MGMLSIEEIKAGQVWEGSGNVKVMVEYVDVVTDRVYYSWVEKGEVRRHSKDVFSFQCRYSLHVIALKE